MDLLASENYLINKAKTATDPSAAKAWIITAKKLYPQNFGVQVCLQFLFQYRKIKYFALLFFFAKKKQFEAYQLEKNANNSEEAANCFSYM